MTDRYAASANVTTTAPNEFKLAGAADWFDEDWAYRRRITITNSGPAQTDYAVRLIVQYISGIKTDFADLRFTSQDGSELPYWVHEKTDSVEAEVWVNVDNLSGYGDTIIFMYFGNGTAADISSGEDTFIFFDGFDDGIIDPIEWTVVDPEGEISETDGRLQFVRTIDGTWSKGVYGNAVYERDDLSFEFDYLWVNNNPGYDAIMFGWHDGGTGAGYTNLVYGYYNHGTGGASTVDAAVYEDGAGRGGVTGFWTATDDYDVRVRMRAGGGAFYEQSEDGGDTWLASYVSSYSTESDLRTAWAFYSGTHEFDNARIRRWLDPEPASSFGAIEKRYVQSGTLTSNVFAANPAGNIWGVLTYIADGAGTAEVRIRTSNNEDMSGAPDFSLCAVIQNGADPADDNCVQDGHKYIQYFIRLNGDGVDTPVFKVIAIMFDSAEVLANAGPDLTAAKGKSIGIDGSASTGKNLRYNWAIVKGDGNLQNIQQPVATYTVPSNVKDQNVEIELSVRNSLGETKSDQMVVHVVGRRTGIEDLSGIVGQAGGLPVYRENRNGQIALLADDMEIVLPEGASRFALAATSQDRLLVGVPEADNDTGKVLLVGQPAEGPAVREISGNQAGDRFGEHLATLDVDGDGAYEVFVSAPGAADFGRIYIYDPQLNRQGILIGTADYRLGSVFVGNYLATSSNSVVFGPDNPAENLVLSMASAAEINPVAYAFMLASKHYFEGITVLDSSVVEATAGIGAMYHTVLLADLAGDGRNDLIMASGDGNVYIYFDQQSIGSNLAAADADVAISGGLRADRFGHTLAVGDVSGDGLADLVIGAPAYGQNLEGALFVVFGKQVWESAVDVINSGYVLTLSGSGANDSIGKELLLADANGDGVNEIYTLKGNGTTIRFDFTGSMPAAPAAGGCTLQAAGSHLEPSSITAFGLALFLSALIRLKRSRRRNSSAPF